MEKESLDLIWKNMCKADENLHTELLEFFKPKYFKTIPEVEFVDSESIHFAADYAKRPPPTQQLEPIIRTDTGLIEIFKKTEHECGKVNYLDYVFWWNVEDLKEDNDFGTLYQNDEYGVVFVPFEQTIENAFERFLCLSFLFGSIFQIEGGEPNFVEKSEYKSLAPETLERIHTMATSCFDGEGWIIASKSPL